ncbi:MAG: sulfurtransferase [Pseudomonadota bacterium]
MKYALTRRHFGQLTVGLVALGVPKLGFAQTIAFANPSLLEQPETLGSLVSAATEGGSSSVIEGLVLVDVRSREEFEAGHIPGAVHLDPDAVAAPHSPVKGALMGIADLEALLGGLGIAADRRILFYDDRGGFHASRMLWLMEYMGHRNVAVLNGGWSAWQEVGGRITTDPAVAVPAVFQSAVSPRRHASAADVLDHRDSPDAVLIDVRPSHLYAKGHIPWAVNIPWSQNLGEDGRFLQAGELLAHFESQGVSPEKDVIIHCQTGVASSHSYLGLRLLGYPRVRVYHRSWAEWGSDPALPKATS